LASGGEGVVRPAKPINNGWAQGPGPPVTANQTFGGVSQVSTDQGKTMKFNGTAGPSNVAERENMGQGKTWDWGSEERGTGKKRTLIIPSRNALSEWEGRKKARQGGGD